MHAILLGVTFCIGFLFSNAEAERPIFIIGHMVNSLPEVEEYLDRGANVLESDLSFYNNGSVRYIYHGAPCDCGRVCNRNATLADYLDHVREITDTDTGRYSQQMIMQFFDLKLINVASNSKLTAGRELAEHVLDNLWRNITGDDRVRVLVYIDTVRDKDTIVGFRNQFVDRGVEDQLKYVGYDGGSGNIYEIQEMFESIGVTSNIWLGDGIMNCFSMLYPETRLRQEIRSRDSRSSFISKVYHWTIDNQWRIEESLKLGVDGMITNVPEDLVSVLEQEQFKGKLRLATVNDDPFKKY